MFCPGLQLGAIHWDIARVRIWGLEMLVFRKILRMYLTDTSLALQKTKKPVCKKYVHIISLY